MKKLVSLFAGFITVFISKAALAAEGMGAAGGESKFKAYIAIAAGLTIAIASLGGAFGQSKVATAAMEGISRNPEAASKVITPMIISLALIESLVIYALVIAFLLQGKI